MKSEALGARSSSAPYSAAERGAGGKLRRPFARKQPSTPYDRPLTQQRRSGVLGGPAAAAGGGGGGGGWISKIVNPAYRLIASGATRLLPSVFSSSSTSTLPAPPLPPPQPQDGEYTGLKQEARKENQESLVNLNVTKPTEDVGQPDQERRPEISNSVEVGQGKSPDLVGDPDLSYVEQLIKGKTFCREEIDRLMEILQSRVVDIQGGQVSNMTKTEKADKTEIAFENPKSKNECKQKNLNEDRLATVTPLLQPRVKEEVGASPVEIAKAYMGSRTSEFDFGSKSLGLKKDRLLSHTDELASNRFLPPPSPKSSICWPGAIIQEQHSCLTPYEQRCRYGRSNHPRTPYSRAIYSKSKSKLTPSEGDGRKLLDISSTPFHKQSSLHGESRISMAEDQRGSVGPIRRLRHKFLSETPSRSSPSLWSSQKDLQVKESILGDSPLVTKTHEPVATSTSIQSMEQKGLSEADTSIVHPHTSKLAHLILEQISRTPTRKEKSDELKLVIAKKNSLTSEVSGTTKDAPTTSYVGVCPRDNERGSPFFKVPSTDRTTSGIDRTNNHVTSASKTFHESSSSFGNFRSSTTSQHSFEANTIPHPHKGQIALSNLPLADTQALNRQKGPISGTKPVLPPIFVDKSNHRVRFASDNCSSGFTFPTTNPSTSSEPPTPSIMPFSSAAVANPPRDDAEPPSYTFGEKKSAASLVFSFPSTSNAPALNDTPVFKFGSEARRVSFSSIGKDAVCC